MNESSQRDHAHERGKGDMTGGDLPMSNPNHEDNMDASMPDTPASALKKGYVDHGDITGATKSHPADMKPGGNNHGSGM